MKNKDDKNVPDKLMLLFQMSLLVSLSKELLDRVCHDTVCCVFFASVYDFCGISYWLIDFQQFLSMLLNVVT